MQDTLRTWLDKPITGTVIMGVIIFNAIVLGLETSKTVMANFGGLIQWLDKICLAIFVAELLAKLIAYRGRFFRDGWNVFDFVIVGIALIPASGALSVLRALRILRVMRLLSVAPQLRRVVEGFVNALPGMASVFLLMGMMFYIGAVIATKLFADTFPEWFGTLGKSLYSLFQVMTLESWSMGIVRPVMEIHPYAWAFFVPFIMVTTFAVVNLLVGLIVNSMQDAHSEEANAATDTYREDVLKRLAAIEEALKKRGAHSNVCSAAFENLLRFRKTNKHNAGSVMRVFRIFGLVVLLAALIGCSSKFQRYNGPEVTYIMAFKEERKLVLLHNDEVLRTYDFELGFAPVGDKQVEGDGKTPEGRYYIDRKNPNSSFHLSIGISYPNNADRAQAAALGKSPGGDIFIHGTPKKWRKTDDWTWGCLAVTDREMEEIYSMVNVGTPIEIYP